MQEPQYMPAAPAARMLMFKANTLHWSNCGTAKEPCRVARRL
jgi:hypothetical protein